MPRTSSAIGRSHTNIPPKDQTTAPTAATILKSPSVARLYEALLRQPTGVDAICPRDDRVLIRRIEEPSDILLTDKSKSIKGIVLAVGPGKWHPGEWWKLSTAPPLGYGLSRLTSSNTYWTREGGYWHWYEGWRELPIVKPGDKVLFNSKWNDLANAENKGTGADGSGPLERPLSYKLDPLTHLVQEADIFAIVPHFDFRSSLGASAIE